MDQWDATFNHKHEPLWFKKLIRKWAIRNNKWRPCYSTTVDFLPRFFDHWGSVKTNEGRSVITQPYACREQRFDKEIMDFANDIGCDAMISDEPAPWHPNTILVTFTPRTPCP